MARHAKQSPKRIRNTKALVLSLVGAVLAVVIATVILLVYNGVFDTLLSAMFPVSTMTPVTKAPSSSVTTSTTEPTIPAISVVMPDQVRGVRLVPGEDYGSKSPTEATVKAEINAFFDQLSTWEFNTVLLPLTSDGKAFYRSSALPSADCVVDGFDAIGYILETARTRGITVMAVVDLSVTDGSIDPLSAEAAGKFDALAKEAADYRFDAVLLTDYGLAYGAEQNTAAFEAQSTYSTYAAFAEATVTAHINRLTARIRKYNPGGKVGLLASAVWAHSTVQQEGSATDGYYEDYTDGYANTRAWITAGLFDMVMVKNYTSTESSNVSFKQVLSWWNSLCKTSGVPLYIEQGAHQVGAEGVTGWVSPDQLSLQWLECVKSEMWQGSVFSSYKTLLEDEGEAVSVLLATIKGESDVEYIANKLVVSSPAKTNITTNESAFTLRGSSDPNFPLLLNGKELETTASHGLFAVDVTLKAGANTYTFEHKGTKVTYTVNYKVDVLTSVSPSQSLTLEGGSEIAISAVARKGATVYAMVGNTKVTMKEVPLQSEEGGEAESDFINFSGVYTMPAGKDYKAQPLGAFTVYVSWNGHTESMNGGKLTVQSNTTTATTTTTTTKPTTSTTTGGGVSQATAARDPSVGGATLATGKLVMVKSDYAETFTGTTLDDYSKPVNSYLPKYTTDVVTGDKWLGSIHYYVLGCGRRVYTSDVEVYSGDGKLTANTVTSADAAVSADYTTLQLGTLWNVPYNLKMGGQSYPYVGSGSGQPEYDITDFTATYVDIAFSYTTEVKGTVSVEGSPLFSKAEWINGSGNTQTLRLYLKAAGEFYGYHVSWMADGSIRFRFRHAAETADGDKPLTGVTIALDPGHGGTQPGASNSIGGTQVLEKTLTLQFATTLRDKLTALGATVVMSRTADTSITLEQVEAFTRKNQPDLFISIHMNSSNYSTPYGPSVHYFYEQSFDLAKSVYNGALEAYKEASGKSKAYFSVGYQWDPFHVTRVHDCPAVLIECGFMSNPDDLELLINEGFRNKFCTGIVNGVLEYLK